MPLEPGQNLSHYRLVEKIGEGGMGVVWKARDEKLRRDVALKVLPADLVQDPDRRRRLLREARSAAAINHPNIGTIHQVDEADGMVFIAMELVEGRTLRALLAGQPLPIPEVLRLAAQMAEGLAAAHGANVVHRDLKPENVLARPDGHLKILDFGLARIHEKRDVHPSQVSVAETLAEQMTREGRIVGTPAYMSPEQARGDAVDARSDVFALGTVLYEMAVGKAPFQGRSATDVLGSILRDRPPTPSDINVDVPPDLDRIIGKCLEKAPEDRYQHTDELAVDLRKLRRETESGLAGFAAPKGGVAAPRRRAAPTAGRWPAVGPGLTIPVAAVVLLAAAGIGWLAGGSGRGPGADDARPVRRFEIDIGKALPMYDWSIVSEFALSPDGAHLAYVANHDETTRLYLRRLDEIEPIPVPGTDHALAPFFSPDGKWVAYYSADSVGRINELRKVPVDGGPPQVLCKAWPPGGGTWLPDGTIVFAGTEPFTDRPVWDGTVRWGLLRVSDNGGTPRLLAPVNRAAGGEAAYSRPVALPGGSAVLFTIQRTAGAWAQPDKAAEEPDWDSLSSEVALLDLATGEHRTIVTNAHDAAYSGSGHILFVRDQSLWAAPFDLDERAVSGPERVVRQGLQSMVRPQMNSPYALGPGGTAVFLPAADVPGRMHTLTWVDRHGARERLEAPPAYEIETPRVSPDGERVLYVAQSKNADIWVHERSRPGSRMRLTYDDTDDHRPVWFPDSLQFLYIDRRPDETSPARYVMTTLHHRADGAGRPARWPRAFPEVPPLSLPMIVLDDGRRVIYQEGPSLETLWDIADSSRPYPERYIVQTPALEEDPVLSPDGRWLAYSALEAGMRQVYVRPFPDTQRARWQLTSEGGNQPLWAPDGSEIYYRSGRAMMAVPFRTRPDFRAGSPVMLFEGDFLNQDGPRRDYDLEYPEGRRFLMIEDFEPDVPNTRLVFVENWDEDLRRLVPAP